MHSVTLSLTMMTITWVAELYWSSSYIAVLQFATIFLYMLFILRLKWFHALLVDATGCLITLFVMFVSNTAIIPPEQVLQPSTGEYPLPHVFTALLNFIVFTAAVQICDRYRLGFTFVSAHSKLTPARLSYKIPLMLSAVTVAAVFIFPPFLGDALPYLLAIAAVCLFLLLRWSLKYEMTE